MKHSGYLLFFFTVACTVSCATSSCANDYIIQEKFYLLTVTVKESSHSTFQDFISLILTPRRSIRDIQDLDFSSPKLLNLARALSPAVVKVVGKCEENVFVPNLNSSNIQYARDTEKMEDMDLNEADTASPDHVQQKIDNAVDGKVEAKENSTQKRGDQILKLKTYLMSGEQWENITTFFNKSGWDMYWSFNPVTKDNTSKWDPSNARELLEYSALRNISIRFFQLGNDFSCAIRHTPKSSALIHDYQTLKKLVAKWPQHATSRIVGPAQEIRESESKKILEYMTSFKVNGGCDTITDVEGACTGCPGMNTHSLDHFNFIFSFHFDGLKKCQDHALPVSLSEILRYRQDSQSSLLNTFVAGFGWLDKLGRMAINNLRRVYRESFFGEHDGLITKTLQPNPVYYLSVLYKRLVEGPVFRTNIKDAAKPSRTIEHLRAFAHCARPDFYYYIPGALVIYYVNREDFMRLLSLAQFVTNEKLPSIDIFIFTSGGCWNNEESRSVKLNGKKLIMDGPNLPEMEPENHKSGYVILPPQSYGFIVIRDANVHLCRSHFHNVNAYEMLVKHFLKYPNKKQSDV